jgi:hypothetical protein
MTISKNNVMRATVKSLIFIAIVCTAIAFSPFSVFAANPDLISTEVNARVLVPQSNGVYQNITPPSADCNYYTAGDIVGGWNGKFSEEGNRLSNAESAGLTFPLPAYEFEDESGVTHSVSVTEADVNRYYEFEMFTSAKGYTRISDASLVMNCHGYSTGLGYWMDSFDTLMNDDYTASTTPSHLAVGAIKGYYGHSIKITGISTTTICVEETVHTVYRVIETREKCHASGVYKKIVTDETYSESSTVPYTFYKKK